MKKRMPDWIYQLVDVVEDHWSYERECNQLAIAGRFDKDFQGWMITVAPVFQELFGGVHDGKRLYVPFVFDAGRFSRERRVRVTQFATASIGKSFDQPQMMIKGYYKTMNRSKKFFLRILLEPEIGSPATEVVDTINKVIRPKKIDEAEAED